VNKSSVGDSANHPSGQAAVALLNEETLDAIQWNLLWEQWRPVTPLARAQKNRLQPFLPGDEQRWQGTYHLLQSDVHLLSTVFLKEVRETLREMPDVREILQRLWNMGAAASAGIGMTQHLSARDMLVLKQFAVYGQRLAAKLAGQMCGVSDEALWAGLLRPFGHPDEPSFAVQHIATSEYDEAAKAYSQVLHRRSEAIRKWSNHWQERLGVRPGRDGVIVCKLPGQAQLAARLKETPEVTWQSDTPYESTFAVPPSLEMAGLQREIEGWQQTMDAQAEGILHRLTEQLLDVYDQWDEAVRQTIEVDLRAAKVVLWHQWGGCTPTPADVLSVTDAVHPLLAEKMAQQSRAYTPLTWSPEEGVNILTGLNMGGKTLSVRLLVTCQVCAQYGLPVPAQACSTRLYGAIRLYAAAAAPAESGLSSFGAEVLQMRDSLTGIENARQPVFHCFDEPAKSTNPAEGEALVVGLIESLQAAAPKHHLVVVTTHFSGAMRLRDIPKFRVRGLKNVNLPVAGDNEEFQEDTQVLQQRLRLLAEAMDYRLEPVQSTELAQEGLRVASWLGLPKSVLQKSQRYLVEAAGTRNLRGNQR